jgi:hypothetical protein
MLSNLDNYEKIIQNFWEIIKVYLTSKNPLFNKKFNGCIVTW